VLWRFAAATKTVVTLEDALEFAFSRQIGPPITPLQIYGEIQALCEIVRQRRPRTVLEIGTERGGTFFLFSRAAAPDAFLLSVDLPREGLKPWRSLCAYLGNKGQNVSVIDGDSHATSTVERVHRVLGERKVDFLFIDGDHSYEGVKQDFGNYVGFLSDAAIVAFHDINPDYWTRFGKPTKVCSGEVYRFWAEVKMKHPHAEFIDNPDQDGLGIGVLFISAPSLLPL
jgi:predicted O-methyltransferase YrrM